MLHGHGNNIGLYANLVADFSSNVWYKGMPDELKELLICQLDELGHYPDPDGFALKNALSACFHVDADQIVVTNGSTEAFYIIAHAFSSSTSIIPFPSFSEYKDACHLYQHQLAELPFPINLHDFKANESLVWLANPNNPDGKYFAVAEIESFLTANPSSLLILDEAYTELCWQTNSAVPLVNKYTNLLVVRSFTKSFGIPGLRLGFLFGSADTIRRINSKLMPWNVNALALTAGIFIAGNYARFLPDLNQLRSESEGFQHQLAKIQGLRVIPSSTNYFLVQSLTMPAPEIKKRLLQHHGLLIRDASNFRGLDHTWFRVSLQTPGMNEKLTDALIKLMNS